MLGTLYENFKSIPIDNEEISQSELNIDNKTRSNLFCWNGQFSPQFIENQRIIAGNAQFTGIAAGRGVGFTT